MNRYLSLFVFTRRFQEIDDNEIIRIISRKLKRIHISITMDSLKTCNLAPI